MRKVLRGDEGFFSENPARTEIMLDSPRDRKGLPSILIDELTCCEISRGVQVSLLTGPHIRSRTWLLHVSSLFCYLAVHGGDQNSFASGCR